VSNIALNFTHDPALLLVRRRTGSPTLLQNLGLVGLLWCARISDEQLFAPTAQIPLAPPTATRENLSSFGGPIGPDRRSPKLEMHPKGGRPPPPPPKKNPRGAHKSFFPQGWPPAHRSQRIRVVEVAAPLSSVTVTAWPAIDQIRESILFSLWSRPHAKNDRFALINNLFIIRHKGWQPRSHARCQI